MRGEKYRLHSCNAEELTITETWETRWREPFLNTDAILRSMGIFVLSTDETKPCLNDVDIDVLKPL